LATLGVEENGIAADLIHESFFDGFPPDPNFKVTIKFPI
jgi:hypothetical protein